MVEALSFRENKECRQQRNCRHSFSSLPASLSSVSFCEGVECFGETFCLYLHEGTRSPSRRNTLAFMKEHVNLHDGTNNFEKKKSRKSCQQGKKKRIWQREPNPHKKKKGKQGLLYQHFFVVVDKVLPQLEQIGYSYMGESTVVVVVVLRSASDYSIVVAESKSDSI